VIVARPGIVRLCAMGGSAVVFACGAHLVEGCGGIVCTETATCPDPDGGDPVTDANVPIDSRADAIGDSGSVADSGSLDATPDGTAPCVETSSIEDCTNGVDDDCNGAIDCADPHCQGLGFSCVPEWPGAGAWTAPVALYDLMVPGGPAPTPPSCAGYYANDILDGRGVPVAPPSPCTCSCGPVQDATCTAPRASVWTTQGCSGTTYSAAVVAGGGCTVIESTQDGINAGQIVNAGTASGSCAPALDTSKTVWHADAISGWAETGRVCAPAEGRTYLAGSAGGCAAGLVCVEPAATTFGGGKICLLSSGQVACPSGYATEHNYYDGGVDTRGCSGGCTCGAPAGIQCQPAVSLYSNGDCSGTSLGITTACTNTRGGSLGSNNRVSATAQSSPSGGACASAEGTTAPSGSVTASTGAATVCCQP